MPTSYVLGYNSHVYYSTNGTSYTKIGQSRDVQSPNPEVGEVNLTNNDSPNNTKEYAPGMIEPGELEFELVYKASATTTLYGLLGDGNIYHWAEKFADGSGFTCKGFIKSFGVETATEDEANITKVTIKLTEKPVFAATLSITTGSTSL
jgi:hypothetical protein